MKRYKAIFFDLDHTLWDYETNSCSTLQELFSTYNLESSGLTDCNSFQQQFKKVNTELWSLYDRGLITSEVIRKERFKQILAHYAIVDEVLCEKLSTDYLYACPKMPYALEILDHLQSRYSLTVVTNGFEEIQRIKLTAGSLNPFFTHIVTSQKAGARKPSRQIFEYAMKVNNVQAHEVVMIGDNLITDIGGALNASIDSIYFNPEKIAHDVRVNYEISCLSELKNIL